MLCNFYNTQNYVFILQVNTVTKITFKRKIEMEKICKKYKGYHCFIWSTHWHSQEDDIKNIEIEKIWKKNKGLWSPSGCFISSTSRPVCDISTSYVGKA